MQQVAKNSFQKDYKPNCSLRSMSIQTVNSLQGPILAMAGSVQPPAASTSWQCTLSIMALHKYTANQQAFLMRYLFQAIPASHRFTPRGPATFDDSWTTPTTTASASRYNLQSLPTDPPDLPISPAIKVSLRIPPSFSKPKSCLLCTIFIRPMLNSPIIL